MAVTVFHGNAVTYKTNKHEFQHKCRIKSFSGGNTVCFAVKSFVFNAAEQRTVKAISLPTPLNKARLYGGVCQAETGTSKAIILPTLLKTRV